MSGFSQNLNVPQFVAYLSADQTAIPTAQFIKILFNVIPVDNYSGFASNQYTVPTAGKWHVLLRTTILTLTDAKVVSCAIYKNGSLADFAPNCSGATNDAGAMSFGQLDCAVGDTIAGYAYHENGSNRDLRGTSIYSKIVGLRVGP